jgi:hypothetical protein
MLCFHGSKCKVVLQYSVVLIVASLLLAVMHHGYASEPFQQYEVKGSGITVDRKFWVPNRTAQHRQWLDAFGFELFKSSVEELPLRNSNILTQDLIRHFGNPKITHVEQFDHMDPTPGYPKVERILWEYPGMVLQVVSYPPAEDHLPEWVVVERVEITSPDYELKYGLRVGLNYQMFVNLFGPPNEQSPETIKYLVEDWITEKNIISIDCYQIKLFLDSDGNVENIKWTWEQMYY